MSEPLQDALDAYLVRPGGTTARALQRLVAAQPGFLRDTPWYDRCVSLLEQGRHDEVLRIVDSVMPGALFCPWAHQFRSAARRQLGEPADAEREDWYAELSLALIADSGEGTRQRPWSVLHVADEYAFLGARELTVTRQTLWQADRDVFLDGLECRDGETRWFEVLQ